MKYNKNEVMQELHHEIVDVFFEKADGSMRQMKCTLDPKIVPPHIPRPAEDGPSSFNYEGKTAEEIAHHCKDKPERWSEAFCSMHVTPDPQNMLNWFGAAINAGYAYRKQRDEGSVVTVWEIGVGWRSFDLNRVYDMQISTPI